MEARPSLSEEETAHLRAVVPQAVTEHPDIELVPHALGSFGAAGQVIHRVVDGLRHERVSLLTASRETVVHGIGAID